MWIWAVIIVTGICSFLSFYMSFLAFRLGDSGVYLFAAFGLLFGILFIAAVVKIAALNSKTIKGLDERISGKPQTVSFVPHRFMMLAIIITVVGILAAILIPKFFR
ncbi:MAG: hypothetical protein JW902_10010 [Syntrophaceae bacterium]|nr:hypothetical protein [Syntrophaceae bacterium]